MYRHCIVGVCEKKAENGLTTSLQFPLSKTTARMLERKKQYLSKSEALLKASRFCTYQDRTQQEVREKLVYAYGQTEAEADEIIVELITQNFINEERFAKNFAGGKFRMKKWGRVKIRLEMEARGLTEYCIRQGLKEIPDSDYLKTLYQLLEKKYESHQEEAPLMRKQKIARYAIGKGYEPDLVWKAIADFEE
jgi:regulatory protein